MVIRDFTPKAFLLFESSGGTIRVVCSSVWEGDFISGTLIFRARLCGRFAARCLFRSRLSEMC